MIYTKRTWLAVALVSGISQAGLPAFADASVRLAGQTVFSVPSPVGSMSTDQRARVMQKNIDNALVASTNRTPDTIKVTYVNGQPVLTLGGFYVCTVDAASAKKLGLSSPSLLAGRWAASMRSALRDPSAVSSYLAQLQGTTSAQAGTTTTQAGSYPYYRQGHLVYIPAGMTLPVTLSTSLNSGTAKVGDRVEAMLAEDVNLGEATIPAHSVLVGQVTESESGKRMAKSGMLGFKFTKLRTLDGAETPISAHIVGGMNKYGEVAAQTNIYQGETGKTKAEKAAIHGAIGAGAGALLGTTVGAIASHGYGTGRGAVSGAVIGGALGVAESLLYRKGADVNLSSGQTLKLQLDAPASLAISANGNST